MQCIPPPPYQDRDPAGSRGSDTEVRAMEVAQVGTEGRQPAPAQLCPWENALCLGGGGEESIASFPSLVCGGVLGSPW